MLPPLHFCQQCLDLPEDLHPSLRGRQLPFQFSNAGITWVSHGSTVGGKRTTASERTAPLPLPLPPDRKPSDSPVIHTACVDVNLADRQAACNPPRSTPAHPPQGSARLTRMGECVNSYTRFLRSSWRWGRPPKFYSVFYCGGVDP